MKDRQLGKTRWAYPCHGCEQVTDFYPVGGKEYECGVCGEKRVVDRGILRLKRPLEKPGKEE